MRQHALLAALVMLGLACVHAHEAKEEPAAGKAPAATGGSGTGNAGPAPKVAESPKQLMKPGARNKIADALQQRGFLSGDDASPKSLAAGLKKFQASEGMPATGFADDKTVEKLGLKPDDVKPKLRTSEE